MLVWQCESHGCCASQREPRTVADVLLPRFNLVCAWVGLRSRAVLPRRRLIHTDLCPQRGADWTTYPVAHVLCWHVLQLCVCHGLLGWVFDHGQAIDRNCRGPLPVHILWVLRHCVDYGKSLLFFSEMRKWTLNMGAAPICVHNRFVVRPHPSCLAEVLTSLHRNLPIRAANQVNGNLPRHPEHGVGL